jgi:hypothetical protein
MSEVRWLTYNSSTLEFEAGESSVQGKPGHIVRPITKQTNKEKKTKKQKTKINK